MDVDVQQALKQAWKDYADACCEHDSDHARHACQELARLIPHQVGPVGPQAGPTKG